MDANQDHGDAIEVIAQFDGSIIDVQHLVPRGPAALARRRTTRALLGGGGASLGLALTAFAVSCARVPLPRALDWVVALLLAAGTWLLLRGLSRLAEPAQHEYTVGDDGRATCPVAPGLLPVARLPLVRAAERGIELLVTPAMTGELTVDDENVPLAEAARRGLLRPSSTVDGAQTITLPPRARAWLALGNASFAIAGVPAPARQAAPTGIDWSRELYTGGVALVVSAFIFLLYSLPPEPQSLALDQVRTQQVAHFILTPPEPPPPPPMAGVAPSSGGRGSAPAAGESGHIGVPTSLLRHATLRVKGTSHEEAKRLAGAAAQNAGILGIMGSAHIGQIFGPEPPLGSDAETILGDLRGDELSDGYGHGRDLAGDGNGPGASGRDGNTIGVGKLHSIGDCATCTDGRSPYAHGPASAPMHHVAKAPDVVPGKAEVRCGINGACLDKEIVRRIVHHHHAEVRFCYERKLLTHEGAGGRVVTQFTIAATGKVLSSVVMESSVRDHDIEECIVQAVRRWEFPQSGQLSIVTYPFILQTAQR